MHRMRTNKVSVAGIDRYLAGLRKEVRASARHLLLFQVVYFLALLGLFALLVVPLTIGAFVVVFLAGMFTWRFYRGRGAAHDLLVARAAFLDALLHKLRDELAPTEKLRVRYHVQPVEGWLSQVKSTRSAAGNTKTYHRSRWLRVRGMLADGTRFRIRLQRATKHKKGQVLREQSALILEVTPPAGAGPAAEDAGETVPWGAGGVMMRPVQGTLVFRVCTRESDMIDEVYRALRFAVARYPGQPDASPAPGAAEAPG